MIRADSSGLAFMNLNAWNIARMLPRTCSGFFLIWSSDEYSMKLIHFGVIVSTLKITFVRP